MQCDKLTHSNASLKAAAVHEQTLAALPVLLFTLIANNTAPASTPHSPTILALSLHFQLSSTRLLTTPFGSMQVFPLQELLQDQLLTHTKLNLLLPVPH